MAIIQLNDLENENIKDLTAVKTGLEKQLNAGGLQPWQVSIVKMHIDDINKELAKRGAVL